MSKQSEIDRRWREYQTSHPNGALEAQPHKAHTAQTSRKVRGDNPGRSAWAAIGGIRGYAIMILGLAVLGGLLAVRYHGRKSQVDRQDWDDWASQAESTGGQIRGR